MGPLRVFVLIALAGVALAACGGGSGRRRGASANSSPRAPTTTAGSAVRPPPAFAPYLLTENQLPRFLITGVSVYRSPGALVSSEQLSPGAAGAETNLLARGGFRVAAKETLDDQGVAALSLVERFGSPAGARAALRFYVTKFRRVSQGGGGFAFFPVPGVPGAVGLRLGAAGGAGSNVAFTVGADYYLLGEEGSGPAVQNGLGAAARSLYRRVRG